MYSGWVKRCAIDHCILETPSDLNQFLENGFSHGYLYTKVWYNMFRCSWERLVQTVLFNHRNSIICENVL